MIPALWRLRLEDCLKLEASLGFKERTCGGGGLMDKPTTRKMKWSRAKDVTVVQDLPNMLKVLSTTKTNAWKEADVYKEGRVRYSSVAGCGFDPRHFPPTTASFTVELAGVNQNCAPRVGMVTLLVNCSRTSTKTWAWTASPIIENQVCGLESWLSGYEPWLFQRTWARFRAPTWSYCL